MSQLTLPANGRKVHFLFAIIHFMQFLYPALNGELAIYSLINDGGVR